jgi:hypothetical protein
MKKQVTEKGFKLGMTWRITNDLKKDAKTHILGSLVLPTYMYVSWHVFSAASWGTHSPSFLSESSNKNITAGHVNALCSLPTARPESCWSRPGISRMVGGWVSGGLVQMGLFLGFKNVNQMSVSWCDVHVESVRLVADEKRPSSLNPTHTP